MDLGNISSTYSQYADAVAKTSNAESLKNKLATSKDATDEDLMKVCKEFEAYFIEFTSCEQSMPSEPVLGMVMLAFLDTNRLLAWMPSLPALLTWSAPLPRVMSPATDRACFVLPLMINVPKSVPDVKEPKQ